MTSANSKATPAKVAPAHYAWVSIAAAIATVGVAIHIAAIFGGAPWFKFFGAPPAIVESAKTGTLLAPAGSAIIAGAMALCAASALSALGVIRRLPMLRMLLASISAVCLLRSIALLPVAILRPTLINTFEIVSAVVWGVAGVGFLVALRIASARTVASKSGAALYRPSDGS